MKPIGGGDGFQEFWQKSQVLCRVKQWNSVQKRMDRLPLFLEGEAFLVWSLISQSDQLDEDVLQVTPNSAFLMTPATVYRSFVAQYLRPDEAVEAFVADLRRFAHFTAHRSGVPDKDPMVVEQMVAGLPVAFKKRIKNGLGGTRVYCIAIRERIRALTACERDSQCGLSAVASNVPSMVPSGREGYQPRDASQRTRHSIACFQCGEVGHVQRFSLRVRSINMSAISRSRMEDRSCVSFVTRVGTRGRIAQSVQSG